MATVQEPRANRFESFVETELNRAGRRIQAQDIGAAALGLLAGTLAYAVGMVLLDRWLDLSDTTRQIGLFAYLAAAVAYAALVLSRPLRRQVNPYFAARQVERAVPGAKNSVISWLDLHAEPLPASIKAAVSQKAAADIKKADVDEVVRDGRLAWVGGIVGGLFVAALILFFLLRPNQFLSLLGRAFTPFGSGAIANQTTLDLMQPAGGDVTVPVNSAVDFRVEVLGRVPDPAAADAVRLRFRYNPADPVWEEIRLDPSPREPREFAVRMPGGRVQNGFVYQIVGGDAATPEHRVHVRSSPLIDAFEVGYHFRPYLRFRDQTAMNPNIESLRGTQITLTARTNRTVKAGTLTFLPARDGQTMPSPIPAEAVPDQPASLRFRFVLTDDAKYQINFESTEGERNEDPIPYTIKVLADHPPQVEITRPAPDTLPINGTLAVEGKGADDFGITAMRLCLRLVDADKPVELASKPYRPEKVFKFADDTYPRALDYKDFLPLDQIKTTLGATVALKPKLVIEYWLEADDNCDNPKPNVGKSKIYKVTLADPQEAADKQAGEKQAANEKTEHDQKQDQDLAKQNREKQQAAEKTDPNAEKQNEGKPNEQPKEGDQQNKDEGNSADAAKQQQLEKQMQKAQEALEKQHQRQQKQNGNNGATGAPQPASEPKGEPGTQKDGNQNNVPNQPAQAKPQPSGGKSDPNVGKPQPNGNKGENRPGGKQEPGGAKQPQPNNQDGKPNPADQKNPNAQPDSKQADQKQPQPGGAGAQQSKPKNAGQPDNKNQQAKNGDQHGQSKPEDMKPGEPKPQPQNGGPNPGEQKQPPQGDQKPGDNQAGQKADGSQQKQGPDSGKPNGEPNAGSPPKQNQPGQPNGKPPTQPASPPGNTKQGNENRTPSENPKNGEAGKNSPPKPEPGKGGESGKKDQQGERPGEGPKKDPNNREPNGPANPNDPGREGAGSKTGANQPGDGAPKEKNPRDVPQGQGKGGAPDPGAAKPNNATPEGTNKGEPKPPAGNADNSKPGQPGQAPSGQGDLKDAAKPHEQPGGAAHAKPTSEGTPSAEKGAGNQANERKVGGERKPGAGQAADARNAVDNLKKLAQDLKSGDAQTRQAAENHVKDLAKELAKQSTGQKSPDPQALKRAEEQAKDMLQQLDKDPGARETLENAMNKAAQEVGKEQLQQLTRDLKSGDPKTRDAAKERVQQLAKENLKPLADDAKSNDPQRQKKADDFLKENVEKDPAARQALMEALKADGKPPEQTGDNHDARSQQGLTGEPPQKDGAPPPPAEPAPPADPKNAAKTSDLQLERFPKNPSKELLQDLGMTEQQYRQFLKDAAELQKKRQAEAKSKNDRGANTGSSAANSGVKRVQNNADKKDQLERGGASLPPEEYRDGYKGFTEDVSKTSGGAKKE